MASAPSGYVLAPDNGSAYRTAYTQTHVDRLRAEWANANAELWTRYDMDLARQKWIQDQLKAEREQLAKLTDLILAEPKRGDGTSSAGGGGGSGKSELIAEIEALKDLQVEKAKRASESQDRVVKLMGVHDSSWNAPTSSVVALSNLAQTLGSQPALYATSGALEQAVQKAIADDRYAGAVAALETEEQRRDAGIKLAGAISARTGLPADQARNAVGSALGIAPQDLDPEAFAVERQAARDEFQRKAYATTDFSGELSQLLEADIRRRMGGDVLGTVSPEQREADRRLAEAYFRSDEWRTVSAALRDAGQLTANPHDPDAMVLRPDGRADIITPDMVRRYEDVRRAVQESDVPIAESDAKLFDDLFLARVQAKHQSQLRIEGLEDRLTKLDPTAPRIEDVRRRTAELYEPESGERSKPPLRPDQVRTPEGAEARTGQEQIREQLDLPSRMSDQQRATLAATRAAIALARGGTAWQDDGSDAQKRALQVRGLLESGLRPDEVYAKIAEVSAGDAKLRDDVYSRVLAYEVLSGDEKKFQPATARATPKADAEPPASALDVTKARRKAALEALEGLDYDPRGG